MAVEVNIPKAAPPPPPEVASSPAPAAPAPSAPSTAPEVSTSSEPDPIADAPPTSEPDPIADAPPTSAPDPIADAPPTSEPVAEAAPAPEPAAVEEAIAAWTGEGWAGVIDDVPEQHRQVAQVISDYYQDQLAEQRMIARALESVIDETGSDPRLKAALETIEKHTSEMEAKQAELAQVMSQVEGLRGQLTQAEQAQEQIYKQQEEAAMAQFFYQNPKLKDPESKEYKRVSEILEDEGTEDLWELWELPDLAQLSKKEFSQVKKLRSEGVPTKYAMELAKGTAQAKQADAFPVDALGGQESPSARSTRTKTNMGGTFQDTLGAVAESTLLKFKKKI